MKPEVLTNEVRSPAFPSVKPAMGLRDIFRQKKKDPEIDPLHDLILSKLKVGYFLDYDHKTWEVTAYNLYGYGDGDSSEEWELTSGREKCYLERSDEDEVEWILGKKIPIGSLSGGVRQYIIQHDDPPEQVVLKEKIYYLDTSGAGYMSPGGKEPRQEFVYWGFVDEEDENCLTIEQWSETEFELTSGHYVEEYQFTDILPGGGE